jgi:hypothetical protein
MKRLVFFGITAFMLFSCRPTSKNKIVIDDNYLQIACIQQLTDVIVHDIFSPPVASRIYAYANIAFYEAIRHKDSSMFSVMPKLKEFEAAPLPNKATSYNYNISAIVAFYNVSKALCFSKDSIQQKFNEVLEFFKQETDSKIYATSVIFGEDIAKAVLKRAAKDNYKYIKGLPKYTVTKAKGLWQQTPPDYMDAVEPNWQLLMPMLMDSASAFACAPPPKYSEDKKSAYYKEMEEVVTVHKNRTKTIDTIARYWDDNPFVVEHKGHFTAATKKITPGGHWMFITGALCVQQNISIVKTALIYVLTSCSIYDGFIACWHEKYKSNMARPIAVIRELVDPNWTSFLQTPPFPEYTSGHSVISTAAATILTHHLGDSVSFTDFSEMDYLGLQRSFNSIMDAANEACISRLYGGIHYRSAIEQGKEQGKRIGTYYNSKIK